MTNLSPEILAELNRRRIVDEMKKIRLEEEATGKQDLLKKKLADLGDWMVEHGEQLRKQNSSSKSYSEFSKKVA